MDDPKLYQVRARAPTGDTVRTSPMAMMHALTECAAMTATGHTEVVMIDLQTGAEAPMDQFKIKLEPKPDA